MGRLATRYGNLASCPSRNKDRSTHHTSCSRNDWRNRKQASRLLEDSSAVAMGWLATHDEQPACQPSWNSRSCCNRGQFSPLPQDSVPLTLGAAAYVHLFCPAFHDGIRPSRYGYHLAKQQRRPGLGGRWGWSLPSESADGRSEPTRPLTGSRPSRPSRRARRQRNGGYRRPIIITAAAVIASLPDMQDEQNQVHQGAAKVRSMCAP